MVEEAQIFKELEQKANGITNILQPIGGCEYSPLLIGTVQFVADLEHPETQAFQKKYKVLREKICTNYTKENLLEITLSTLMQE